MACSKRVGVDAVQRYVADEDYAAFEDVWVTEGVDEISRVNSESDGYCFSPISCIINIERGLISVETEWRRLKALY